jgi:hypothetical protein
MADQISDQEQQEAIQRAIQGIKDSADKQAAANMAAKDNMGQAPTPTPNPNLVNPSATPSPTSQPGTGMFGGFKTRDEQLQDQIKKATGQ